MKAARYIFLSVFFFIAFTVTEINAQQSTRSPTLEVKKAVPLAGAYRTIAARNLDVRAVYQFAIKTHSAAKKKNFSFVKVLKAESQVVAGTNYRICMLVREGNRRSKSVTVVVNRDLTRAFSLVQWVEHGCKEI